MASPPYLCPLSPPSAPQSDLAHITGPRALGTPIPDPSRKRPSFEATSLDGTAPRDTNDEMGWDGISCSDARCASLLASAMPRAATDGGFAPPVVLPPLVDPRPVASCEPHPASRELDAGIPRKHAAAAIAAAVLSSALAIAEAIAAAVGFSVVAPANPESTPPATAETAASEHGCDGVDERNAPLCGCDLWLVVWLDGCPTQERKK
jgi:hypothetical protein